MRAYIWMYKVIVVKILIFCALALSFGVFLNNSIDKFQDPGKI